MQIYIVQPGDTVDSIAEQQNTPAESIIYNNQLVNPYRLAVGQALLLSSNGLPEGALGRPDIHTNGYAYPFISPWVLGETLPFLSELSIFSYGFTPEGNLVPPAVEEGWMIEAATDANATATLTLTPLGEDGRFNNNLIHILVTDLNAQQNLTRQLLMVMMEKGYRALNFDFEYIMAQDRLGYVQLVGNTTRMLNLFGFQVSVALAPKYSDEQEGELYEGMDYALLGAAANSVLLMTYEWGYTYGPPMAVAPIDQVRRVVEYAITRIPREKISLGIPNYGYDWPLPYQRGITSARTLGNAEAVQLAIFYGVEIQFDETAQSPFFRYWQYGTEHEVWFQDVRSYQASFDLIKEFGLRGAGYWQIMQLFRANWLLLADTFEIEKT